MSIVSDVTVAAAIYDAERRRSVVKSDEEDTDPGVGPGSIPFSNVPFPRINPNGVQKGTKCYLCARQTDVYLERSVYEFLPCCSICVDRELGYDIEPNGALRKRPPEDKRPY